MEIKEILAEIDQRPIIPTLVSIISEISPQTDSQKIHTLIKLSIRCACLFDLLAETGNSIYQSEIEKQRTEFYQHVPEEFHPELKVLERSVVKYFDDEKIPMSRIEAGDKFTIDDVKKYLSGKSGDNLFYGRLFELMIPEWNHTRELHFQTMLFDMGKDLIDYEDDVKRGLPNTLSMCLSSGIPGNEILDLATGLRDQAIDSGKLNSSPTFRKTTERNYSLIVERLQARHL